MDENGAAPSPKDIRPASASRRWLVAAITATVCGAILLVYVLTSLWPGGGIHDAVPIAYEESTSALVVVVSRTPGGPGEWDDFTRVIGYLSRELDRPVRIRYLTNEEDVPEVVTTEDIDIGLICAHHYFELAREGVIKGVVTPVVAGTSCTRHQLIVRADSEYRGLSDLRGSVVAASTKSSLGGWAYLQWMCDQEGLDLDTYFGEVRLGATQGIHIADLAAGRIDATVVNTMQVVHTDMSPFRVLAESPEFGAPPVVVDSTLDPETVTAIREALLAFDPEDELPGDSFIDGFVPVESVDYSFQTELAEACDAPHAE